MNEFGDRLAREVMDWELQVRENEYPGDMWVATDGAFRYRHTWFQDAPWADMELVLERVLALGFGVEINHLANNAPLQTWGCRLTWDHSWAVGEGDTLPEAVFCAALTAVHGRSS